MKKKVTKNIAILTTMAMTIGLLLANPFTGIQANAATVGGYKYTSGVDGLKVFYANESGTKKLKTEFFHLTKDGYTTLKALSIDLENPIKSSKHYTITTAGEVDSRTIGALYDITFNDPSEALPEPTPIVTPAPIITATPVTTPAITVIEDDPAILAADAGEVLGATRSVKTDDASSRWFAIFGISVFALTGIALKKKR